MNLSPSRGRVSRYAVILTIAIASNAHAQDFKNDGEWRGTAGLSASLARGNTDTTQVAGQLDAYRATTVDKLTLYGTSLYGKRRLGGASERTADNLRLGARYDRDFRDRMFWFGLGEYEHDTPANLDLRVTAATGLGYKAVRSPRSVLDVFGGLAATLARYNPGDDAVDLEVLVGIEARHQFSDTVSVRQKLTLYPNLSERGEYRSVLDAALVVAMTNRLNLQIGLQHRHDSLAPTGTRRSDTVFLTGISLRIGPD